MGGGALLCAALFFGILGLVESGFRFDGLRLSFPATVTLTHVPQDARLYADGREIVAENNEGTIVLSLAPNAQHLIVSHEGFWPWEKEMAPRSGEQTTFGVFLMPRDPQGTPILDKPLCPTLEALVARAKLPTRAAPILSADGTASLFVENGKIITRWLSENPAPDYYCIADSSCREHAALTFEAELRDLAFYPGRNDIALLAIQNGIFALDLDNRGTQTFQPVYRGTRPRLLMHEGAAYLQEGKAVLRLTL